jgi:hypothetical protein
MANRYCNECGMYSDEKDWVKNNEEDACPQCGCPAEEDFDAVDLDLEEEDDADGEDYDSDDTT